MKYFYSLKDQDLNTYSIDNCILEYTLKYNLSDYFLLFLQKLRDKYDLKNEYWERLNCLPCSHWSWYSNHIHLCNGIYISLGKYNALNSTMDKYIAPVIKLEINLNKHSDKECFKELNKWLKDNSGDINLIKYDLAIDIPTYPKNVKVFGSNKEKGLYKGTRYYGQRNKNGYCKIYDKQKEQELDYPLTRVEHTIVNGDKKYKKLSLEKVYISTGNVSDREDIKANDTDICIISMLKSLQAFGEDTSTYIDMLGYRKKKHILEIYNQTEYKKIEYDMSIIEKLLNKIKELTGYTERTVIFTDKDGFLKCSDYNIPFN